MLPSTEALAKNAAVRGTLTINAGRHCAGVNFTSNADAAAETASIDVDPGQA